MPCSSQEMSPYLSYSFDSGASLSLVMLYCCFCKFFQMEKKTFFLSSQEEKRENLGLLPHSLYMEANMI